MVEKSTNPENLKAWCEKLRSGDIPQATLALKTEKGMCCLGVACDISGLGTWGDRPNSMGWFDFEGATKYLPDNVMDHLGLKAAKGINDPLILLTNAQYAGLSQSEKANLEFYHQAKAGPDQHYANITRTNDVFNWSFEEIADGLERTYL